MARFSRAISAASFSSRARRDCSSWASARAASSLLRASECSRWLLWIAAFRWAPFSDAGWYHQAAIDLAHGFGYRAGELPTAYFPIGYPAFLAGLFLLFPATQLTVALARILV